MRFLFLLLLCGAAGGSTCPCGWLEKGGIWAERKFWPYNGIYAEPRCPCLQGQCSLHWSYGPRSLTFRWIGMDDTREMIFQMRFCRVVMRPFLRFCNYGEPSYALEQVGTWLLLRQHFCRCILTTTEVDTFTYPNPVSPADPVFRGTFMNMTCSQRKTCAARDAICFREPVFGAGKLHRGHVLCACPQGTFCPIYYIAGRREPVRRSPWEGPAHFVLRCRPRLPGQPGKLRMFPKLSGSVK